MSLSCVLDIATVRVTLAIPSRVGVGRLEPLDKYSSLPGALTIIAEDLEKKINLTICLMCCQFFI